MQIPSCRDCIPRGKMEALAQGSSCLMSLMALSACQIEQPSPKMTTSWKGIVENELKCLEWPFEINKKAEDLNDKSSALIMHGNETISDSSADRGSR